MISYVGVVAPLLLKGDVAGLPSILQTCHTLNTHEQTSARTWSISQLMQLRTVLLREHRSKFTTKNLVDSPAGGLGRAHCTRLQCRGLPGRLISPVIITPLKNYEIVELLGGHPRITVDASV